MEAQTVQNVFLRDCFCCMDVLPIVLECLDGSDIIHHQGPDQTQGGSLRSCHSQRRGICQAPCSDEEVLSALGASIAFATGTAQGTTAVG